MARIHLTNRQFFLTALVVFALGLPAAFGQSRQIIDYTYDDAGNLVRIESIVSDGAPVVVDITPGVVRREETVRMTAAGSDLRLVEVTSPDPAVSISNVQSTPSSASFDVSASTSAVPGTLTLGFTTQLGSASGDIQVQPRRPGIMVAPTPLAIAIGQSFPLVVSLSSADIFDHALTFEVSDTAVAGTSTSSVTVVAGDTQSADPISISGDALGTTRLTVSSPELADVSFTIFVTESFVFPIGPNAVHGPPLGVVLETDEEPPTLITKGPFAAALSVFKNPGPPEPVISAFDFVSPAVGALRGGALERITPAGFVAGAGPVTVTAEGRELDTVTGVALVPPADVTLGALSASPGGETATFNIDIDALAATGERQLVFETVSGTLMPSTPGADRILIVDSAPEILSLEPIVLTRLTPSATLIIRGRNLAPVESVDITPSAGILLGAPVASTDGSEVTLGVAVTEDAPLGDRVVTVTTPVGTTDATATVRNTLAVINGPASSFTPFYGASIGVVKGESVPIPTVVEPIIAPSLGVTVGSVMMSVMPSSGIIGSTMNLTIAGAGLENVDDVQFVPQDGIAVNAIAASVDGLTVDVEVTIALDAAQVLREVRLFETGFRIEESGPRSNRFAVTAPLPRIASISPIVLVTGDPPVEFAVYGENFDDALAVNVIPPDDVSISAPVVAPDGRSLTVDISADAGAALGLRAVQVDTPAGVTASTGTPANTLNLVDAVTETISPLVAPIVGVLKDDSLGQPSSDTLIVAPILGVTKSESPVTSDGDIEVVSPQIGVGLGTFARAVAPSAVPIDTSFELTIRGAGLENVTDVEIFPADGITFDGPITVLPDGTEVRVSVTVGAAAPTMIREVIVTDTFGEIVFSDATGNRLRIAAGVPLIESIDPIQEVPGAAFTLTIRGFNLNDAFSIFAEPSDGVVFGINVTPSGDGREVTVDMSVDTDAVLGPRVIRVDTPAGVTTATPSAANTFTVVSN